MLINSFKLFFAFLFSLIIVELYFQILERTSLWRVFSTIKPILGEPDYMMGYKFTPNIEAIWLKENKNKIKINSYGFNDFEIKNSEIKVVITGDSMIESLQVPLRYNFENLSEQRINNKYSSINKDLIEINNLAMSGHGPLRQLITIENYGYNLNPKLIVMYLPLSRFINDEMIDDSYNPAYKFIKDNKIERSFNFRDRQQIKLSNNFYFKNMLRFIQESSVARLFYYAIKSDFAKLIGINSNKKNQKTYKNHNNNCQHIEDLKNIFFNDKNKKYKLMNHFFKDLYLSSKNNNVNFIFFFTGFDNILNCNLDAITINKIENIIYNFTRDLNAINVNLDYEIENLLNIKYSDLTGYKKKYLFGFNKDLGEGHLNYFGHEVYSQILERFIEKSLNLNEK
jgi:hypothetical protein